MFRSKIINVFWITVVWTIISIYQFLISYSVIKQLKLDLNDRLILIGLKGTLMTGVLAGLIGGSVLVFVWEKWLRTKPYGWTLKRIFITYTLVFYFVSYTNNVYFEVTQHDKNTADISLWLDALILPLQTNVFVPYFLWLIVVIVTMITFLVNDKYGPGIFRKFLMGKYFDPKKEERVFMFLDLKSSTAIAEHLGEEKYFNFIKDVFKVATPGILKNQGEIYQYVGDEVVISWPIKNGIENNNCLKCYFDVKKQLKDKEEFFRETYEITPEFKAGLHYGYVMAGEVGVVKRDIVYSGDTINTTSRIQGKCNELKVNILFSKFLLEKLAIDNLKVKPRRMGEIDLRGKKEKIELYSF